METLLFFLFVAGVIAWQGIKTRRARAASLQSDARSEALFKASFPELQPYLHPKSVLAFADAWLKRGATLEGEWANPNGFPAGVAKRVEGGGETTLGIFDSAGQEIARLRPEAHPEGLALRTGEGKFTVDLRDAASPRVRYWHPQRQFKWSQKKGWEFTTPLAEHPFEATPVGSNFVGDTSSLSSSSSSSGGASYAGGGGEFGGGGASASWDEPAGDTAASGSGGTAY